MTGLEKLGKMQNKTAAMVAYPYFKEIMMAVTPFSSKFIDKILQPGEGRKVWARTFVVSIRDELGQEQANIIEKYLNVLMYGHA